MSRTLGLLACLICFGCLDITGNTIEANDEHICDPNKDVECIDNDGAMCTPANTRTGACINDVCLDCFTLFCKGQRGCSPDPAFAHNGNAGNECPDGCFVACAM